LGKVSEVDDLKMPQHVLCPVQLRTLGNIKIIHHKSQPSDYRLISQSQGLSFWFSFLEI